MGEASVSKGVVLMSDPNGTLGGISRETFLSLDDSQKLGVIFDILVKNCGDCVGRITKLESRKRKDTAYASVSGFVGGFAAVVTSKVKFFWGG